MDVLTAKKQELQGSYANALVQRGKVQGSNLAAVDASTVSFMKHYEWPSVPRLDRRKREARRVWRTHVG